jgi:hypothetical protein
VLPEALSRLLRAVLYATLAAVFGGIGTALAFKAVDDSNIAYGFLAALTLGLALVGVLAAVIAAAGGRKPTSAG